MNPYDFYSLDDFLEFSPLSPNYANLNMVSSPRFRSPRIRSAFAIVPVPEDSSIAYHKEIYTVLFDPPSFLMIYSIVRHLWKLSKSKKFLPLPPLPKSQPASIDFQELPIDSISEAKGENSSSSTSVLESVTANHHCKFSFGIFHSVIVPIKLINAVQPQIEGCAIKIGEITCSLVSFNKSESVTELKEAFQESIDPVVLNRRCDYFDIAVKAHSFSFVSHVLEGMVHLDLNLASMCMSSLLHSIRNTIIAVETVFDPGGVVEPLFVTMLCGAIMLIFSPMSTFHLFIILATVEFIVIAFDPGGNRRRT
ncbi:hypothetical protein QL285_083312 [Trifolium repens]|nr:hypothetical protein QL285_083312 [Trifolium repens]